MGIHSGPVSRVVDVNERSNVAGAGINMAERVMRFGDAGHILLSKRVADDLAQYGNWRPCLHEIGEYEVKGGGTVSLVNLYREKFGNPNLPMRCQALRHQTRRAGVRRRAIMAGFLLLAVFGAIWAYLPKIQPAAEKSIAVLPFENLSDEKGNAFFTSGVQDEILSDLARVAQLKVISRTSTMRYKDILHRNHRQIGRDLGVIYLLEGSVQRVAERIRVSTQLVDARNDSQIWADRYDAEITDVFRIQSEVAEKVVGELRAKLSPGEKAAIEERPTGDLTAYDLYLRARTLIDSRSFDARMYENLLESTRLLDRAIEIDKEFALAYYQLATAHDLIYSEGFDRTPARLAQADVALSALVRLRPDSGEAHLARAQHLYWGHRNYDEARRELVHARQLLPNEPVVPLIAGYIDRRQGHWDDSIRELKTALDLDPGNISILQQLSFSYDLLRQFKDAAAALDRVVQLTPTDIRGQFDRAFLDLDWHADARPAHDTMERIVRDNPDTIPSVADRWTYLALYERDSSAGFRAIAEVPPQGITERGVNFPPDWFEGWFEHLRGDHERARQSWLRAANQIIAGATSSPERLSVLGLIHAVLGKKEEAIAEGKRAVELIPPTADAIKNALAVENLAIIYAWSGERDAAIEQLKQAVAIPSGVNYGYLRLHPYWDPLRDDPRFDRIVASMAPQPEKP
jgi:serine/threonine-protein kinase